MRLCASSSTGWDLLDVNPLQGIRLPKKAGKRDVVITPHQIKELCDELTPTMAAIVQFSVYRGRRREEILGLRVENVTVFDLPLHDHDPHGQMSMQTKGGRSNHRFIVPITFLSPVKPMYPGEDLNLRPTV